MIPPTLDKTCHLNLTAHALILILLLPFTIICHCNLPNSHQTILLPTKPPQAYLLLFNLDAPFEDKSTRSTRPFSIGAYCSTSARWNKNTKAHPAAALVSILNTATPALPPTSPSAPASSSAKTITSLTTKGKPEAPPTVFVSLSLQTTAQLTMKISPAAANKSEREWVPTALQLPPAPNIANTTSSTVTPTPRVMASLTETEDPSKTDTDVMMMSAKTRQGNAALRQTEELRLINKKKNNKARKLEEEEEKRRKDKAEEALRRSKGTAVQPRVEMTPQNLHDILNGVDET